MLPLLEIAFTISGTIIAQNIDLTSLNKYSTEERVIGKWIDGRPVHQKTIQGIVHMKVTSHGESIHIYHNIEGLTDERVFISYEASFALGSSAGTLAEVLPRIEQEHQAGIQHLGKTQLVAAGSWPWGNSRYVITLRYVK